MTKNELNMNETHLAKNSFMHRKTLVLNSGEELFESIRDNKISVQDLRQVVQQMPKLDARKTSATTHVSIEELIKEGHNSF